MLFVANNNLDPYVNMAIEEYLLKSPEAENCFMLWQNLPAVIVGRNQNALEEIDTEYVRAHDIAVVRRLTGGGAVYHDLGNLNFTFVVTDSGSGFAFERFARPVIKALQTLGVKAEHSGRNDITVDGRKFSGNAEYRYGSKLLHHGTLLFDSDLSVLSQALNVKQSKIESKGVKSVRSRVTNLREHLAPAARIEDFRRALVHAVADEFGQGLEPYTLTGEDMAVVEQLSREKYSTWAWNYGHAPRFTIQKSQRFAFGEVDVRLDVREGVIAGCHIYGDFFSHGDMEELARALVGTRYSKEDLSRLLHSMDLHKYLPGISCEDFVALLTT